MTTVPYCATESEIKGKCLYVCKGTSGTSGTTKTEVKGKAIMNLILKADTSMKETTKSLF